MLEILLADLLCFTVIFIVSSVIMLPKHNRTYWSIIKYFGFIGVTIHEFCHYIVSVITGIIPEEIHIEFRKYGYGGYVDIKPKTFWQSFLGAFAPIILITWLVLYLYDFLFSVENVFLFFIIILIMLSAIVGVTPSYGDLRFTFHFFKTHPLQSSYEILIAIESFFIASYIILHCSLIFSHTIYYYLIIAALYLAQIWIVRGSIYAYRRVRDKMRTKRGKTAIFEEKPQAQW
jgi:hypothetical protein